jgi:16S rRNA (cytosine1402-N4)-methyltransferase
MACSGESGHRPVLLDEVVEQLAICREGIYVDCTFGRGGHTRAILNRLGERGQVLAIDKDPEAVEAARDLETRDRRFTIEHGSFTMLESLAKRRGIAGEVKGILFDLGVSSPQLEAPARGFSFLRDGPLDMRMDPDSGKSAAKWLAMVRQEKLAEVLQRFGEERFAKRIARAIVEARRHTPITSTQQLAAIIARVNPAWEQGIHPATRCFQAIRIFLNQELDQARGDGYPANLPVPAERLRPTLRLIGKAIRASRREVMANPRSRSAVLRVAEKLA